MATKPLDIDYTQFETAAVKPTPAASLDVDYAQFDTPAAPPPPAPAALNPTALDYAAVAGQGLLELPQQAGASFRRAVSGMSGLIAEGESPEVAAAREANASFRAGVNERLGEENFFGRMVDPASVASSATGLLGTGLVMASPFTGPAAPAVAVAGGTLAAASLPGMYRDVSYGTLAEAIRVEEEKIGRPLTAPERQALFDANADTFRREGAVEVAGEAAGMGASLLLSPAGGAATRGFIKGGTAGAKLAVKEAATRGAFRNAVQAGAAELTGEMLGETGTTVEQDINAQKLGLPNAGLDRSFAGYYAAAKEVAPVVLGTAGLVGTIAGGTQKLADIAAGKLQGEAPETRERALEVLKFKAANPDVDVPDAVVAGYISGLPLTGEAPAVEPPPVAVPAPAVAEPAVAQPEPVVESAPERLALSAPVNISLSSGEVIPAQQFYRMLNERLDAKAGGMTKEEVIRSRRRLMKEEQQFFDVQAIQAVPEEQRTGAEKAKLTKYKAWLEPTVPAESITEQKELVNDLQGMQARGSEEQSAVQALRGEGEEVAPVEASDRETPKLTNASYTGASNSYISFDSANRVPTRQEIEEHFNTEDSPLQVVAIPFKQNLISATQGVNRYRLEFWTKDGRIATDDAARQVFETKMGATNFNVKSALEEALPLGDRFGTVVDTVQRRMNDVTIPAAAPAEVAPTSETDSAPPASEAPASPEVVLPRLKRGYRRQTFTVADPVYKNYVFVEDVSSKGVSTLYTKKNGEAEVKAATPAIAAKVKNLEKIEAKFDEGVDPIAALTKAIQSETGQPIATGTFTQVAAPRGQEALFAALAQTLKKEIIFFKNNGSPMSFNGATGIAADTIYVNIDSAKPHLVVTGHEFLHDLKREEPETYAALRDVIMDVIPEKRRLEMWEGLNRKRRREGRQVVNMTAIEEELVADFFGEQFTSKEFWAKVERRNPEGFAGLVQRLIAFLDRIKAALTGEARADIERAQTAAAEALARYVAKNPEVEYELSLSEPVLPAPRVVDDRRYVMDSYREAGLSKVEPTTKEGTSAGRRFGTFDGNELVDSNEYNGTKGNKNHITRTDFVWIPTKVAANLRGVMGEKREWSAKGFGNFTATKWKELKKDIFLNGFEEPIFITQDYGQSAKVSEGNHRIQAAEQLGLTHIPAEIRYFGRSEEDGLVFTPKQAEDFGLVPEAQFSETPKANLTRLKDSLLSGRVTTQALPSVLKVTPLSIVADLADAAGLPWVRTFYKTTMQRDAVSNGIVTDFGLLGKELARTKETTNQVAAVADVASIHQMKPQDDIYSQDWIAAAMRGAEDTKPETKESLLKGAQTAWEAAGMQASTGKTFREAYLASRQAFDALPEELQEHYLRAVEMMKDLRQREKDAAQALIEEYTQDNLELRAEQIAQLDLAYNNLKGNYWPVYRKGDYTLDYIEKATGLRGYSTFDTVFEREVVAKSLVDAGLVDPATLKLSKKADAPRGGFGVPAGYNMALGRAIEEKAIAAATEGIDPKDTPAMDAATAQARATAQETIQTLHEVWLRFQPEASAAKNMMRRKNIKGYDGDMVRGFLEYGQTHAVKVAQMEQGRKIERTINDMAAAIRGRTGDTTREMAILIDLRAREAVKSQPSHWLAKKLGTWTTFKYMTSPSIALVQMTQLGILTLPKLATLRGSSASKAAAALSRGTQAAFSTKFTREKMYGETEVQVVFDSLHEVVTTELRQKDTRYADVPLGTPVYTPVELQAQINALTPYQQQLLALQEAMDRGLLDISLAHEVNEQVDRKEMNPVAGKVFDLGMTFMRESEKASRKAAILAAFEVGGGQQDFFAGMETVAEVVDNTLFNYSKSAKGVALQGDLVRVLTTFQTFRINAIGKLFVLFRQTIKGETAEVQQAAKRELVGIFGMSGILAGALGMPLGPLVFQLFDAIVGDDDDEPSEEQFRKWLASNFGQTAADVVTEGVPSLLGASLSRRIGLGDVVGTSAEMPARLVGDGAFNWLATQAMGPSYSMLAGYAKGYNEIFNEGEVVKGLISSTPKPVGDMLKAYGYAREGVKTGMGKRLLAADQVGANEVVLQAFGFAPLEISRMKAAQYDLNTRSTRLSMQWGQIKQDLVKAYIDGEPTDDEMVKVREFIAAHPGLVQNAGSEIRSSLREYLKKDAGVDSRREMLLKR